jgi:hypothetical protein
MDARSRKWTQGAEQKMDVGLLDPRRDETRSRMALMGSVSAVAQKMVQSMRCTVLHITYKRPHVQ